MGGEKIENENYFLPGIAYSNIFCELTLDDVIVSTFCEPKMCARYEEELR